MLISVYRATFALWLAAAVVSHTNAQTRSIREEYEQQSRKYRSIVKDDRIDIEDRLKARAEHRAQLQRMLESALRETYRAFDYSDLVALAQIANELGRWKQVVEVSGLADTSHSEDRELLRLTLHAHLELGNVEIAEHLFTTIKRLEPTNGDIAVMHIAFANAYDRAGRREEHVAHLESFLTYMISALPRHRGLADSFPSMLARYRAAAPANRRGPFVASLSAQSSKLADDHAESNAHPTSWGAAVGGKNALVAVRLAIAIEKDITEVAPLLLQWTRWLTVAASGADGLSARDMQEFRSILTGVSRYSCALNRARDINELIEAVDEIQTAYTPKLPPDQVVGVRRAFNALKDLLSEHLESMKLIGTPLTQSDLEWANHSNGGPLILWFWPEFAPQPESTLASIRKVMASSKNASLSVIVRPTAVSLDVQRRLALYIATNRSDSEITTTTGNVVDIATADAGIVSMKACFEKLRVGSLPRLVVIDRQRVIRAVILGMDDIRIGLLDQALQAGEQTPPSRDTLQRVNMSRMQVDRATIIRRGRLAGTLARAWRLGRLTSGGR